MSLVSAINDDFFVPFSVMLFSLLDNSGKRYGIDFFILDSGVSEKNKEKCNALLDPSLITLHWISVSESLYNRLPLWGRGRTQLYHSLLIPELLPVNSNKMLYLDADLLILGDIEKLWEIELEQSLVGAVQDMVIPVVSAPMGLACYKEMGLSPLAPYFNSGVFLINLLKWRSENIVDKVIGYLKKYHQHVALFDQDGYNAVLSSSWKALDLRWNVIASMSGRSFFNPQHLHKEGYDQAVRDPWIIHYAGHFKPWLANLGNRYDNIYKDYLKKQNWINREIPVDFKNRFLGFYDRNLRCFLYHLERLLWIHKINLT
ncbi:glycosyltransferase family 8 protein [Thermodesulfobacteriota bacterium]